MYSLIKYSILMKALDFIQKLGIDSFSELRYKDSKLMNGLRILLIPMLMCQGIVMNLEGLILSGFALWGALVVTRYYKEDVYWKVAHEIFAVLFFVPLIYYGGLWSLVIPLLAFGYLYWKERKRNIHVLVLEVLLFITSQIGILI